MKLDLQFGFSGPTRRISWWQGIKDFPVLVMYKGKKWEFLAYGEDATNAVDYICTFGEVPVHDPSFDSTNYIDVSRYFDEGWNTCTCGAIYGSFSWDHMRYCAKWTKW